MTDLRTRYRRLTALAALSLALWGVDGTQPSRRPRWNAISTR